MVEPQPAKIPIWNTGGANRTEPLTAEKTLGWTAADEPPSAYFNWLQYYTGAWLTWLNERIYKGTTEQDLTIRGLGPAASGPGGEIILQAGPANTAGAGGDVSVFAGPGAGAGGNGGTVRVWGASGAVGGGDVDIRGGTGSGGAGGAVALRSGTSVGSDGADIDILGSTPTGTDLEATEITLSTSGSRGTGGGVIGMYCAEAGASGSGLNAAQAYLRLIGTTGNKVVRTSRHLLAENTTAVDPARGPLRLVAKTPDPVAPALGDLFTHTDSAQLAVYNGIRYQNLNPVVFNMSDSGVIADDPTGSTGPVVRVLNQFPLPGGPVGTTPLRHIIPAGTLRAGSIIRVRAIFVPTDIGGGTPYHSPRIYLGSIGAGPSPFEAPSGLAVFAPNRSSRIWDSCSVEAEVRITTAGGSGFADYSARGWFDETGTAAYPVQNSTAFAQSIDTSVALDLFPAVSVPASPGAWKVDCEQFVVDII